jgi:hypothetical protein
MILSGPPGRPLRRAFGLSNTWLRYQRSANLSSTANTASCLEGQYSSAPVCAPTDAPTMARVPTSPSAVQRTGGSAPLSPRDTPVRATRAACSLELGTFGVLPSSTRNPCISNRNQFGLTPIGHVLRDHDVRIAPGTSCAVRNRPPSNRQPSDERHLTVVQRVHRECFGVYGVRQVWHAVRCEGLAVGRDRVARVMRLASVRGQSCRKRVRTTVRNPSAPRLPDLVRREWRRDTPDLVWVVDFERHEAP